MPRSVAEFTGEWVQVIPDVTIGEWSNILDPQPVSWEVHPMSSSEDAQVRRRSMALSGRKDQLDRMMDLMREVLSARIRNVRNYRVRGKDILDGADLAESGEQELVLAAWQSLVEVSKLDEALKKTSEWQSVFSAPTTPP